MWLLTRGSSIFTFTTNPITPLCDSINRKMNILFQLCMHIIQLPVDQQVINVRFLQHNVLMRVFNEIRLWFSLFRSVRQQIFRKASQMRITKEKKKKQLISRPCVYCICSVRCDHKAKVTQTLSTATAIATQQSK